MKRHIYFSLITVLAYFKVMNCAEELFISVKDNKFFIEPAAKYTWFDARKECDKRQMDLLSIETEEKSKEVKELLSRVFTGTHVPRFYIGATDYVKFREFCWITPHGRVNFTYTNWENNEPNNYKQLNERCVHIGFHGTDKWNDINCGRRYGFICQERTDFISLLNAVNRA